MLGLWSVATIAVVTAAGCSSPPPVSDGVPEDSVVAAGVVVGPDIAREIRRRPQDWPVELRPGRAIILADGSLRADVGPSVGLDDRPGITRQLRRSQLAGLWRDLDSLGLGAPSAGNHLGNPTLLTPSPREIVQVIELQRDGRDWTIVHRFEVPEAPPTESSDASRDAGDATEASVVATAEAREDPRMRAAIRRIAALAWASDLPPDSVPRYPERYDFGPDPWARYRAPSETDS